jgi:hypothetical protein
MHHVVLCLTRDVTDLLVAQGVIDSRRQQEAIPNARAHPGANNAPKRPRSPVVQSATAVKPEPISLEDDDDEISQLEVSIPSSPIDALNKDS